MWYENYDYVPKHDVGKQICVRLWKEKDLKPFHFEFNIYEKLWEVSFTPDGKGKYVLSAKHKDTRLYFEGVCCGREVVLPPLLLDMNRQRMGTGYEEERARFEDQLKRMKEETMRWFVSEIKTVQMHDRTWYVQHAWRMTVTNIEMKQEQWTAKHEDRDQVTALLEANKTDPTIVPYTITAWGTWGDKTYASFFRK